MIPNDTVLQIIEETQIEKVVGKYVELKRKGANMVGCCPFHNEKTPSFTVSPAKNIFKCFGCGVGGDAATFIQKINGITFPEAIKQMAADLHITIQEKEPDPEAEKKQQRRENLITFNDFALTYYISNLKDAAKQYALTRMSAESITDFKIGYATEKYDGLANYAKNAGYTEEFLLTTGLVKQSERTGYLYDFFQNRLIFPIYDHTGRLISFTARTMPNAAKTESKYINLPETDLYVKGNVLYGLNLASASIRKTETAILVEGNTDVISLHQLNCNNVVAAGGTALTDGQLKLLKRSTKALIMLYDGDNAGRNAAIKNSKIAIEAGFFVYILFLPWQSPIAPKKKPAFTIQTKTISFGVDPGNAFTSEEQVNHFVKQKVDFITYYANHLLQKAGEDPSLKNDAVKELAQLIHHFEKGVQEVYIDTCTGRGKLKAKLLRDEINALEKAAAPREEKDFEVNLPPDVNTLEYERWGFFDYKNEYYFRSKSGYEKLSNFIMVPLFHIDSIYDSKRIYEIENNYGYKVVVNLDMQEMTSLQAFQRNVEGKGNFLFWGTPANFNRLKLKLYEQTHTCTEITVLGWQKEGFWAWSNGVVTAEGFKPVDEYGVCEVDGVHYFIPAFSQIYINDKSIFIDERKFRFKSSEITLNQWANLFITVFGNNAKMGIAYWVATTFRDHIIHIFKNYPLLNLFGPKGTGKSQMAMSLSTLYGIGQTPFNIHNGTKAGLAQHIQTFANAFAWIDEYKNSIEFDKIETLKSIYDAIGRSRMNMDKGKKKETTEVNSAVIISGQEMPTADIALFSRVIFLRFNQSEYSNKEKQNYDSLKKMESEGLSHLTNKLLEHRQFFIKNFYDIYQETLSDFNTAFQDNVIEDRIMRSVVSIIAAWRTISKKIEFPFDYEHIKTVAFDAIETQNAQISQSNELGQFWNLLESLFDENILIDKWHFRVDLTDKIDTTTGVKTFRPAIKTLKFKFNTIYSTYAQHARRQGIKPLPSDSLMYYLKNHKTYIGVQSSCVFTNTDKNHETGEIRKLRTNTSAFCFLYEALKINLEREDEPQEYYAAPSSPAVAYNGYQTKHTQTQLPLTKSVGTEDIPF